MCSAGKQNAPGRHPTILVSKRILQVATTAGDFREGRPVRNEMNITYANHILSLCARLIRCLGPLLFLALAVSAGDVLAQEQPQAQPQPPQAAPTSKIAVEVKAVSVLATVRDKH